MNRRFSFRFWKTESGIRIALISICLEVEEIGVCNLQNFSTTRNDNEKNSKETVETEY